MWHELPRLLGTIYQNFLNQGSMRQMNTIVRNQSRKQALGTMTESSILQMSTSRAKNFLAILILFMKWVTLSDDISARQLHLHLQIFSQPLIMKGYNK